jgi:hypothetical protein
MKVMRTLWWGIVPTVIYVLLVSFVAETEFNCDGEFLCGYATYLLTLPSQLTIGKIFSNHGLEVHFTQPVTASDIIQLAVHIGCCALLVFLLCFGLAWFWRRYSSMPLSD